MKKFWIENFTSKALSVSMFVLCFLSCSKKKATEEPSFATKTDSLEFAKTVFKKYPGENKFAPVSFLKTKSGKAASEPVDWDIIKQYKENYDRHALLYSPAGKLYKGFILDEGSLNAFKSNTRCSQLYFRLGLSNDDEYTIMVLPMDARGNILQISKAQPGQDLNQDHLDPCPDICPRNWDN